MELGFLKHLLAIVAERLSSSAGQHEENKGIGSIEISYTRANNSAGPNKARLTKEEFVPEKTDQDPPSSTTVNFVQVFINQIENSDFEFDREKLDVFLHALVQKTDAEDAIRLVSEVAQSRMLDQNVDDYSEDASNDLSDMIDGFQFVFDQDYS